MNWLRDFIERVTNWAEDLNEGQRRIFLAGLLLVGAAFMGFLIYWVFFRDFFGEEQVSINGELVNVSQLPDIIPVTADIDLVNVNEAVGLPDIDVVAKGGNTLSQVIRYGESKNVVLSGDGKTLQYYDPETGKFYRIDENGNVIELSDKVFQGVEEATWSNDGDKAVIELEDGFNIVYDFDIEEQYTLHEDMADFDFSPNDNQISFKFEPGNPDDNFLGISSYDGSGAVAIEHLGNNGDQVNPQWSPSGQSIGTFEEYVDGINKSVLPLGFKGENFKDFIVEGRGFDYEWSPSGRQMLYSTYTPANNYNPTIHIVNAYGDEIGSGNHSLNLNTSVDKCTFTASGNSVYCSVPTEQPIGLGINPDNANDIPHDIYKVDIESGFIEKIATPVDQQLGSSLKGATSIIVSKDESILYYTEADTGNIRRILLK